MNELWNRWLTALWIVGFLLSSRSPMFHSLISAGDHSPPGAEHAKRLVGTWELARTYVALDGNQQVNLKYVRKYLRWEFRENGTVVIAMEVTGKRIEREFRYRTRLVDKNTCLELLTDDSTYLIAQYVLRDGELWIGFSLNPKEIHTMPPSELDLEKAPNLFLCVLKRLERK
ncbi:hypothetical protein HRbin36_00425 [bacterium HR36]|nr:hypothetical protein HRbin36_00425 [bacterium HR36]